MQEPITPRCDGLPRTAVAKKNGQAKNGTNGPMQNMSANTSNKGWKHMCDGFRPTCDIVASKS